MCAAGHVQDDPFALEVSDLHALFDGGVLTGTAGIH